MAICVEVNIVTGDLRLSESTECLYQLLTSAEIQQLNGLNGLFAEYFNFDSSLFSVIVLGSLLSFASGHVLGRLMHMWRKAM